MGWIKKKIMKLISYQVNVLMQASIKEIDDGLMTADEMKTLCRKAAAEGMVLLENRDVLPLKADEQVAVFGRCQINPFYVGYGSGGDIRPPYRVSIAEGLRQNGLKMDEQVFSLYEQWCEKNPPDDGFWGAWPMNYDEMPVSEDVISEAAKRNEKAIVIIGRAAGEDRESKAEKGSWYLTDIEKKLLVTLKKHFRKVAVLLNCGSIMDTSFVKELELDGAMYIWQGGQELGNAVYDVLTGAVNPCGKLTDTVAKLEDYPSDPYFGDKKVNEYVEDIYVGYRYFSSFGQEKVLYPFGYGLSYTTFKIETTFANENQVAFTVTNTGNCPGREVVQLYAQAPNGKLGKPSRVLIDFVKTKELDCGESQSFTMDVDWSNFASYDDSGVTGHPYAWVIEPGEYKLYLGTNVVQAKQIAAFQLPELILEQCVQACAPDQSFQRMVRVGDRVQMVDTPANKIDKRIRVLAQLPAEIPMTGDIGIKLQDVVSGTASMDAFIAQLTVEEMEALSRGSLESMNSKLGPAGNAGVFGGTEESLRQKGVPVICTNDGPSGVRLQAHSTIAPSGVVLASTFDEELVSHVAEQIGREVIDRKSHVILAPGMNIHRHPLCGRNFEYFSEDPLLTGRMAAAYVRGIQASGVSATPKHFACNNQEVRRNTNNSRVSERALREIYLKGFEICVKNAKPDCLMTAYNLVNGEHCYDEFGLTVQILRNEWKYEGLVMTDWWMQPTKCDYFKDLRDQAYRIRAHANVFMPGSANRGKYRGKVDGSVQEALASEEGITLGELQYNAKRVLTFCLKHMDQ